MKKKEEEKLRQNLAAAKEETKTIKKYMQIIEQGYKDRLQNKKCPYANEYVPLWNSGADRAEQLKSAVLQAKITQSVLIYLLSRYNLSDEDQELVSTKSIQRLHEIASGFKLDEGKLANEIKSHLEEYGAPISGEKKSTIIT